MADIHCFDCTRNVAFERVLCEKCSASRLDNAAEANRAALRKLRLALETATRELTASRADVDAMQAYGQEQRDRAVAAERERDEIFAAASKIELSKRVVELERDLRLNASMLAKQCDMARVAEMAQTAAERERDEARRHAEEQLADVLRLRFLGIEFASQYGDRALACKYDNSCDDSGREPECIPCAFRRALGLMGVN